MKPDRPSAGGAPTTGASGGAFSRDIDALYRQPFASFTRARNELARTLTGAGAREAAAGVKALVKPAVVPWAVNQVFWQARSIWDRLLEAGVAVRAAQIAAIEKPGTTATQVQRGRDTVRDATATHRQAVADAVHQAVRLAGQAGVHPNTDQIARMLEALSLAPSLPSEPGRFTEIVRPAGFEALSGVTPAPALAVPRATGGPVASVTTLRPGGKPRGDRAQAAQAARRARVAEATDALSRAGAAAAAAEDAERRAGDALADAELRVTQATAALRAARSATRAAITARDQAARTLASLTADA